MFVIASSIDGDQPALTPPKSIGTLAGILAGLLGLKFGISPVVELTPISDEGTEPLPPVETDEGISPIDGMGEACSDPSGKAALVSPELLPLERL